MAAGTGGIWIRKTKEFGFSLPSGNIALMFTFVVRTSLAAVLLFQAPTSGPFRIHNIARRISAAELAEMRTRFPDNAKGEPWLLVGLVHWGPQVLEAYLPAQTQDARLRRGIMVNMARYGTSPSWKYLNTEPWAQVALPGRGFETLQDDGDLNRPFTVAGGDISDDDLIKIVTLIRSSRLKPGVPHLRDEGVYGTLPILRVIRRSPASVVVMLFVQDVTYQFVHLSQSGNDWSVDYVLTMVE